MRVRSTSLPSYYTINSVPGPMSSVTTGYMLEESKRPCNVTHIKQSFCTGFWCTDSSGTWTVHNFNAITLFGGVNILCDHATKLSLNRDKLFTTNKFGLLQFIAELDDSIALFTKKFWKSLSYGKFTWGVLPFVSEMKNLLSFISKAEKSFGAKQRYEDERSKTLTALRVAQPNGGIFDIEYTVTRRYSGIITYPVASQAQQWLDRLGFHPDINVAWDLLPLSFMVDWFLPVGKYIESLHSSGWVRHVDFNGWYSEKIEWKATMVGHSNAFTSGNGLTQTYSSYRRIRTTGSLRLENEVPPKLSDVSGKFLSDDNEDKVKQLFDTAYLLISGRKS